MWLQSSTREPWQLQYFKSVFLEMSIVTLSSVFLNLVTYMKRLVFRYKNINLCLLAFQPAISGRRIGPQQRISIRYHRSVVPIKTYPLCHSESFHPSLLFLLYYWSQKRWEIAKEVSINCNGFYLLCHTNGQMHISMIISVPTVKIFNKNNVFANYKL